MRELVDEMAESQPESEFLVSPEGGRSLSFRGLQEASRFLAAELRDAGLEHGDKVAFLLDNGLFTAQLFLGAMYGGFVAVPLNVRAGVSQVAYMLDHCDAKVVFVEAEYSALLDEAMSSVKRAIRVLSAKADCTIATSGTTSAGVPATGPASEDVALLMYSSGSTGQPKAAIHTHGSVLAGARNSVRSHQLSSADRSLLVLPLYHINAECVTLVPTLLSGGSVVVPRRFSVSRFWDWIDDYYCTWSALVPTIISELVEWNDPRADRRQGAFERIRFFRSSSAPLAPSLHRQFLDKFNLPLLQAMGSTEAGNVFSNPLPPGKNKIGSPGLPWGFETRIVDRNGREAPAAESGEVLLRGAALMKAYYKDPEGSRGVLDAEGWLHTGDLAYRDEDGYFFVVGRSKELIIKGGVNIAPRQIDEVLESHPAVLEAAAVGVPDHHLGEDVVAFAVLRTGAAGDEKELLSFCESRLGHFKTPTRIRFVADLPKGPSGKVQRLRLFDEAVELAGAGATWSGNLAVSTNGHSRSVSNGLPHPTLSIEQTMAAIWGELLGIQNIDAESNFFALGGHSLLAMQCISRLREKLPVGLSLSDFFENGTIAQQAALIRRRLQPAPDGEAPDNQSSAWEETLLKQFTPPAEDRIPPRNRALPCPLSPAQQRLWFDELLNPGIPLYNEAEAVRLVGELNVEAMERALNMVIARHEVLRSTIQVIDGVPNAIAQESWQLHVKKIDLSCLTPAERETEVERLLVDEPRALYNLESEPGIRATLLLLSSREHVFILMMHHTVCDWASEGVLWREFSAFYRSLVSGNTLELPAPPLQYWDYAAWQQKQVERICFAEDLNFWEEQLRGAPAVIDLPADRLRPPVMSHRGSRLRWKFDKELGDTLRDMSRRENTTLFIVFAAALNSLIFRYTGNDDVVLGIPLADREKPQLQDLIGFFLHTHVLRTRISEDLTFRQLLARVQKQVLGVHAHRSVPFDQVVQRVRPERNPSYTPLYQVMINWRDRDQLLSSIGLDGLEIESLMAESGISKFDLFLFVTDLGDEIWLEMEYNADLFDEARILRMLGHYETLMKTAAADPGQRLGELQLLTTGERDRTLYEWNQTDVTYPRERCVHELIEDQAERTPEAIAAIFEATELTYRELNERADNLAGYLQELGVGSNVPVGICVERSLEMLVGLLGILKAGGTYVPLDPSYPGERLAFMLKDSQPLVLLTQKKLQALLPHHHSQLVCLDALPTMTTRTRVRLDRRQANDLAYILYTSGSTGVPKGVQIPHRALVNFLSSMRRQPGITAKDTLLAVTTLSFDIAGLELYLPLTCGARVVVASAEAVRDADKLLGLMQRWGVNVMQATPSTWRMLLDSGWAGAPKLKILCGGEPWPTELANELLPRCESLWNMYGPTETTIWSAVAAVEKGKPVLIGAPIANTTFYVLDACRQPMPVGVPGELYIGGDGLAEGYLGRNDLTRERFVDNPFSREPGARIYRTGDLVRYTPDGHLEFIGRMDHQVKVRGFRIELGEIEAGLVEHAGVHEAVAVAREDTQGDKRLVTYYTGEKDLSAEQLRRHLAAKLPEYMIPAAYMRLDSLPLTPNGKVDRRALPAPDNGAYSVRDYEAPVGQIETTLAAIWAEVLKVERVGRRDNFFDLGGHSMLSVRVVGEINRLLDVGLTIPSFFLNPTIEAISRVITEGGQIKLAPKLIPLQRSGSGAMFYLDASIGLCRLAELVRGSVSFATSVPLTSAVLEAAVQNRMHDLPRLEDLAAPHAALIRSEKRRSPCVLVGHSFHGLLAFEVAHQLHRSGVGIAAVVLLDSLANRSVSYRLKHLSWARAQSTVKSRVRHFLGLELGQMQASVPTEVPPWIVHRPMHLAEDLPWEIWGKISLDAARRYRCRPIECAAILVRARDANRYSHYADMGWGGLFRGGLRIVDVAGDHMSLLREPQISELADTFKTCLTRLLHDQEMAPAKNVAAEQGTQSESSAAEMTMRS